MSYEYFVLIRRQRRPCLLAIDDGLSLAGQHAGPETAEDFEAVTWLRQATWPPVE